MQWNKGTEPIDYFQRFLFTKSWPIMKQNCTVMLYFQTMTHYAHSKSISYKKLSVYSLLSYGSSDASTGTRYRKQTKPEAPYLTVSENFADTGFLSENDLFKMFWFCWLSDFS